MKLHSILLLALCGTPPALLAQQKTTLPSAAIKGIEATPRVTFIVPWQRSQMKAFPLLPAHSALDEYYRPISSGQLELDIGQDGAYAPLQHNE